MLLINTDLQIFGDKYFLLFRLNIYVPGQYGKKQKKIPEDFTSSEEYNGMKQFGDVYNL